LIDVSELVPRPRHAARRAQHIDDLPGYASVAPNGTVARGEHALSLLLLSRSAGSNGEIAGPGVGKQQCRDREQCSNNHDVLGPGEDILDEPAEPAPRLFHAGPKTFQGTGE